MPPNPHHILTPIQYSLENLVGSYNDHQQLRDRRYHAQIQRDLLSRLPVRLYHGKCSNKRLRPSTISPADNHQTEHRLCF